MDQSYEAMIQNMLEPFLLEKGFEFVEIEYVKQSGEWFLRVFVDKEGGIDLEDCSDISEYLSKKLDEEDPIPHAYYLEVSSPGAERPLRQPKDFYDALNKHVFIKTYEQIEGMKEFEGELVSYDEQTIVIKVNVKGRMKTFELPVAKVALARLAVMF